MTDTKNTTQPEIDHFKLPTDVYIGIRRFLGQQPHDGVRLLIAGLDALPAITKSDMIAEDHHIAQMAKDFELAKQKSIDLHSEIDDLKKYIDSLPKLEKDPEE